MKKLLTINQVVRLCQGGVDIRLVNNKPHPRGIKGEFDMSFLEIVVYKPNIESHEDMDITILHEFIHARNYTNPCFSDSDEHRMEEHIEEQAVMTYIKRPYLPRFIKQLYSI